MRLLIYLVVMNSPTDTFHWMVTTKDRRQDWRHELAGYTILRYIVPTTLLLFVKMGVERNHFFTSTGSMPKVKIIGVNQPSISRANNPCLITTPYSARSIPMLTDWTSCPKPTLVNTQVLLVDCVCMYQCVCITRYCCMHACSRYVAMAVAALWPCWLLLLCYYI